MAEKQAEPVLVLPQLELELFHDSFIITCKCKSGSSHYAFASDCFQLKDPAARQHDPDADLNDCMNTVEEQQWLVCRLVFDILHHEWNLEAEPQPAYRKLFASAAEICLANGMLRSVLQALVMHDAPRKLRDHGQMAIWYECSREVRQLLSFYLVSPEPRAYNLAALPELSIERAVLYRWGASGRETQSYDLEQPVRPADTEAVRRAITDPSNDWRLATIEVQCAGQLLQLAWPDVNAILSGDHQQGAVQGRVASSLQELLRSSGLC